MNDEVGFPEISMLLTIGFMLVVFGIVIVSWLIVLITAGLFWRTPLPPKLADQIRMGLSALFDTRAALADPARGGRDGLGFSAPVPNGRSRRYGPTTVS